MIATKEPLIYSGRSRLGVKIFRFKARIARNGSPLRTTAGMQEVEQRMEQLPRFATPKLDILEPRYEFTNRSEVP